MGERGGRLWTSRSRLRGWTWPRQNRMAEAEVENAFVPSSIIRPAGEQALEYIRAHDTCLLFI